MLSARQRHCLQGMGIDLWRERGHPLALAQPTTATAAIETDPPPARITAPEVKPEPRPAARVESKVDHPGSAPVTRAPVQTDFPVANWQDLQQSIEACQNCTLAQSCTRKVPGKGDRSARLMIIGEAPGRDEDLQGKPFVGRAGQLLDRMLEAIDLDPGSVYITNILKCRPPQNRDPKPDEIASCGQFLAAQIELVQPEIILSVGRISAQNLLNDRSPVGRLRGHRHQMPGKNLPLLVTYHPAYLLRNAAEKAKVWQDLKTLKRLLDPDRD